MTDPRRVTEADFARSVTDLARAYRWEMFHPYSSKRSRAGWPDWAFWKKNRGLILAELKSATGRLRNDQVATIITLREAGVDVRVWRPKDWPEIEATLRGKPNPHPRPEVVKTLDRKPRL